MVLQNLNNYIKVDITKMENGLLEQQPYSQEENKQYMLMREEVQHSYKKMVLLNTKHLEENIKMQMEI